MTGLISLGFCNVVSASPATPFAIADCGLRIADSRSVLFNPQSEIRNPKSAARLGGRAGFTLVEMLIAMTITLVMMGAVVTLFANISNSVRNRRATIEMSSQLRHVRNVLQQDLQ